MSLFLSLFLQLLPLYTLVGVGYIAARFLAVKKTDISRLLIYVLTPAVSFGSIVSVHLSAAFLSLPLLSFVLCTCIAGIILFVGKFIWHDGTANMLSVGIANGNFGFIGLPLAAILLGQQFIAPVVLFGLGAGIFIATLGIYITARANFNARESFYQVLKMPMVHAFAAGILALRTANLEFFLAFHISERNRRLLHFGAHAGRHCVI